MWYMVDYVPIYSPVMRQAFDLLKKMRNKISNEPKSPHVFSRRLATITCKKYGEMGHSHMSYKGKIVVDIAIPKGGNKAKKAKANKGRKGRRRKRKR